MLVLAIESELEPIDRSRDGELLRAEAAVVWTLKKGGLIRDLWFTVPDRRAVVMLDVVAVEEAKLHLDSLPLVKAGKISFEVMPLRPYDGFERLFAG